MLPSEEGLRFIKSVNLETYTRTNDRIEWRILVFLKLGRLNELRCQSVLLLLVENHALLVDLMKLL
jgi:hypothetical protein